MFLYFVACSLFSASLAFPQDLSSPQPRCESFGESGYRCVPYYQCNQLGNVIVDGDGLIDPRDSFAVTLCDNDGAIGSACDRLIDVCCCQNEGRNETKNMPTCGMRNKKHDQIILSADINLESETRFGEWPHVCAIIKSEDVEDIKINVFRCAGSLISPGVILTAAHCVNDVIKTNLFVRCGEWDTFNKDEPLEHQERKVESVFVHPDFNERNLHWDFALLIMEMDFILAEHINPVCLPSPNQVFEQKDCVANGWGKDKFGSEGHFQKILKQVYLPIVDHQECQKMLSQTRLGRFFRLDDSFICAGGERGVDTCKGDGGGPLTCWHGDSGSWVQAGIISWGIGCGDQGTPAVYARVSKAVCWMEKVMRCNFGSYPGNQLGFEEECFDDYSEENCALV